MIVVYLFFMVIGFSISHSGVFDSFLDRFRFYDEEDDYEEEEEPAPVVIASRRRITIFPKQKKGKAGKYYHDGPRRFECDMVTYKEGVLVCHIKDSLLEEEFNIKDIDEFII